MNDAERELRAALRGVEVPEEAAAAERAWRLVRAANAEQPAAGPPRPRRRRALQLALVAGLVAAVVSPAGASVRHWVADAVSLGVENAKPALTSLPDRGSLLVRSTQGPWVVHADGSKRLLGDYGGAAWSPHGLYVAVTSRHELATIDPAGHVRWTLERRGPVRLPSWNGPDGFRIAYLDGSSLRVVNGDSTGDHLLSPRVAPIAPAWMPGPAHVLAFARPDGRVEAIRADDGGAVFETRPGPSPISLQWSGAGRTLLVSTPERVELLGDRGGVRWRWSAPRGTRIVSARLAPHGDRIALALSDAGGSHLLVLSPDAPARRVFSRPGRFSAVEWSPGGVWLLLAWQSADQWLFLNSRRPAKIDAISNVSGQFAPGSRLPAGSSFPQISGWCCSG
jgi:hypothetical protein